MELNRLKELHDIYKSMLFEDIIPFWTRYSIDNKYGGYNHYLDRDGSLLSTDKSVWLLGRQLWTYSYLYNNFEKKQEWLEIARTGYDFINKFCFDRDGRMFFQVTSEGKPLRKRRYFFTETFGIIGLAEYAKATNDEKVLQKARDTFNLVLDLFKNPQRLEPKVIPQTRSMIGHVGLMLFLSAAQTLREIDTENAGIYNSTILELYELIIKYLLKKNEKVLLELVSIDGKIMDYIPQGRCIAPGHGIEEAWFLLKEGIYRNNNEMKRNALDILDWSLEWGWDKEFGGIFNFVDLRGLPTDQVSYNMKYWWPHNEALYALLLASYVTDDEKYAKWYEKVHDWTFKHFPDSEYGEWYGYLNRDGSVCLPIKGGEWKGSFHVSRMFMFGIELIRKMIDSEMKK